MRGLPKFRETLEVLDRHRVECIVVGGVAAVLQGYRDPAGRRIEPDATRLAAGGHHLLETRLGPLDVLATIGPIAPMRISNGTRRGTRSRG